LPVEANRGESTYELQSSRLEKGIQFDWIDWEVTLGS
jgi:hypothetical protein